MSIGLGGNFLVWAMRVLVKIKTNGKFENLVSIFSVTIIIIMIMMFMK